MPNFMAWHRGSIRPTFTWADGALLRARSVSGMSICHTADLGGAFCAVARTA
jgi:hypothetical protein